MASVCFTMQYYHTDDQSYSWLHVNRNISLFFHAVCYFNAYCLTPGWLMRFSNLTTLRVNKHQKITKAKAGLVLSYGSSFTAQTVLAPACCDDYRNVP